MATKDLHDNPFDQGTIAKLEIFEEYAEAWIPPFVMRGVAEIAIFDFFAGTGYDKKGIPGSPIRILKKLLGHKRNILHKGTRITLYLNEYQPDRVEQKKFKLLKSACEDFLDENTDLQTFVTIEYHNEDFGELFNNLLPIIKSKPSLVFLDQNGIKFLSDKYFLELEKTRTTDFLYFVSSSYFWRFGNTEEFKINFEIDMDEAKASPYRFIHRSIIGQLRKRLPKDSKLKLYPFSIKKGANIHGIVFGAKHPLAVDKFLNIAWKRNRINGEAEFDIDEDAKKSQMSIFEKPKLSKVQKFKENLKTRVLAKEITNNFEALEFTYAEGHIPEHTRTVLSEMKKNNLLRFEGKSSLVTYKKVHVENQLLNYSIPKK